MSTKKPTSKKSVAAKPGAKARDLKPKKDAKGGARFLSFPPPRDGGD